MIACPLVNALRTYLCPLPYPVSVSPASLPNERGSPRNGPERDELLPSPHHFPVSHSPDVAKSGMRSDLSTMSTHSSFSEDP